MPTYKHRIKEHDFNLSGSMSIRPLDHELKIEPLEIEVKPIAIDPVEVTSTVVGDKNKPVATTSDLTINNLPMLNKQDIKDLLTPEVRMHIPNYQQICFQVFGIELFSICLSGEAQVITEPFRPNAWERCDIPCCEPDTRPFPKRQSGRGKTNIAAKAK